MSLIRLALGCRHGHRLGLVPKKQASSRFRGKLSSTAINPLGSSALFVGGPFLGTMFPTSAGARKNPGMTLVLNSGVLAAFAMVGSLAGPAKISPSMSKITGPHMVFVLHSMPGHVKYSEMPGVSHSGSAASFFVGGPFLQTMFPTLAGARKKTGMRSVPIPVGTSVSQITLGGLYRSFSTKAGSDSLYGCPEDENVEQLPHNVEIGDSIELKQRIENEKKRAQANISGFKARYFDFVRPMLSSRCLIAPAGLSDPSTVFLHHQTYKIVKYHPRYLSILDVMTYEDGVRDFSEWTSFLDYLTEIRIYIIEDENLNEDGNLKLSLSFIGTLMYDHGIIGPNDGTDVPFYKGECDGSFVKGTASSAYIIWKGDKIICSEVYQAISCDSATEAEVFAAFALLSKAKELKILKLLLCSDCEAIPKILGGQLIIDKDHLHQDTYLMLRSMRRHFKNLIATWKPRELMGCVDDVAKADVHDQTGGSLLKLKERWSSHLKGQPVFRIEWTVSTQAIVKKFAKRHIDESFGTNSSSVFFVHVEEKYKLDCLIGIKQSLGPNNLVVHVNDIEDKPPGVIVDLKKIIGHYIEDKSGCYSCFAECAPKADVKNLVVVFDAVIPAEVYYQDAAFHVLFVTGKEMKIINENNIPELNALAFVYFNGVKYPLNDHVEKKIGDQTKHQKVVKEKLSSAEGDEGA